MIALKCRACGTILKDPFLSLGSQPLSNAYLTKEQLTVMEPHYPLDLYVCAKCRLVQLPECEKAENIFNENYAYFSSFSESWLAHCREYTEKVVKRFEINKKSFVIEVASNDGYLLQYFKAKGIPVLGVEPAAAAAKIAKKKGIPTDVTFFNTEYANRLKKNGKQADLIAGNNVLAHNPNLVDFVKGLKVALKPDGVITLEFPHLLRFMESNQFDTVYHEHYSYISLYAAEKVFAKYGLKVFDVDELKTHGGSLRIYCRHTSDKSKAVTASVKRVLSDEKKAGLLGEAAYAGFRKRVEKVKFDLLKFLLKAKADGKTVAGYGAAAKGNTLLNYCGVRTDFIEYTVDRNPAKQNRYLPGTHIPIYTPEKIMKTKPDYVLILPWNIKDEVMQQMNGIKKWGGKFVVAIPELQIMEK
ncbi:MAG: methyltransferase domain-containing protein [Fibrobacteres bacterium]|nr:methyltransferase domain-containing protein [Fibrobacterota bacterium]